MSRKEPELVTFGCRLNTYESEVMRTHAKNAGLEDAIIFNTCAVTKEAERQARQAIRRARRDHPKAKIIVTGCSAQIDPETYAGMEEVDQIIGNDLKLEAETWGATDHERVQINDIMSVKETASHLIDGVEGHARAFIQVQNGCDHRCTFCIIPYGRGNSRSVPIGEITDQVRKLVESGYNEIVFTGVDVTSYGSDLPGEPTLGQMIRRVLALVPELPRLRLSSLDPVEIDDDLWRLIAEEPRLMPHLHMSLQAGDDMVLKRMKRRHLREDAIAMCERAREYRPDMVFGADIIAGFPTETDEMFARTLDVVEECDLTFLHVFPYSEREGTPAAKMPQVPHEVRKARAAQLRALGEKQVQKFLKRHVGQKRQVIVEQNGIGRTEHFAEVQLDKNQRQGALADVMIKGIEGNRLTGKVL
ncbi:MAG: tRNA (N(6)-L-threonylcarbamoyladenosine(37)-C(2))-methylthiotransferase MtaB [Alphaproteobacteria bacterium]|nr:tRNA (N(6)-L-threonylcarbamoyladenosine(37)-C(2))-methylthiotransferase MtaB [Alphaproteobacteria bacterium]